MTPEQFPTYTVGEMDEQQLVADLTETAPPTEGDNQPAPAAEATTAPPAQEPTQEQDPWREAIRSAEAELGKEPGEGEEGATPPPPAGKEPNPAGQPEAAPVQSALDRLYSMWKQGREGELSPAERGVLRRFQQELRETAVAEFKQNEQQEAAFRQEYLRLRSLQEEDPDNFTRELRGEQGDRKLQFMKLYEQAHPGISLDNPDAPPVQNRANVRQQALEEAFRTADQAILDVAQQYGLSEAEVERAFTEGKGTFHGYATQVVQAAVAREAARMRDEWVAKEKPKWLAAERQAIDAESQARWVRQNAVAPRYVPSASGEKEPARGVRHSGDLDKDLRSAAREAEQELQALGYTT